jgi:hypothetical protein
MSNKFVNHFNDYLKQDNNETYNKRFLDNTHTNDYSSINYYENYQKLLKKSYQNNLIIEKKNSKCMCNDDKILDKNNYVKTTSYKGDIINNKISNSPFDYDKYNYL